MQSIVHVLPQNASCFLQFPVYNNKFWLTVRFLMEFFLSQLVEDLLWDYVPLLGLSFVSSAHYSCP